MFTVCTVESIKIGDKIIENIPINLANTISVSKDYYEYKSDPDEYGFPCIKFKCVDGKYIEWLYKSEKDRDADYYWIISGGE